uniref:Sulfotransferase family 4A member 1 n=1 Tax=Gallus gallus TaxID=9031 RepID=A0A8V0YIH9_CHICK
MAESEAETPSTPGEFESKYFEYNGVRLPPFCRGKMEEIANFPVRDSDVWIVTYPKSGHAENLQQSQKLHSELHILLYYLNYCSILLSFRSTEKDFSVNWSFPSARVVERIC